MSILRVGSTKKFAENWDHIFAGGNKSKAAVAKNSAGKKAATKKSGAKSAKKAKNKKK